MVLFKEFGILNSYTIESTFYGGNKPKNKYQVKVDNNFEENLQVIKDDDLFQVGRDFCETLLAIINSKIMKKKFLIETSMPIGFFGIPG